MLDDVEIVDGDAYFGEEDTPIGEGLAVEANGDATPVGDVDSDADLEVGDTDLASDDSDAADERGATPEGDLDEDVAGEVVDEWLPGFEGRFRVGEESKAFEAYQQLEKEFSGRKELEQQYEKRIEEERRAAFEQAATLLQQAQPQRSVIQQLQEQQQLQAMALTNPGGAFQAALQTGDEQAVNAVISTVARGDLDLGIEPDADSAMQMMQVAQQMQSQNREQQLEQRVVQMESQQAMARAGESFRTRNEELLSQPDVAEAFARKVEANWGLLQSHSDADGISQLLDASLDQALGQLAREKYSAAPQTEQATSGEPLQPQRPAKRRPHVEGAGSQRAPRVEKQSESDDYADEIFAAARQLKPTY